MPRLPHIVLTFCGALLAWPALANLGAEVTLTSDYAFRGISHSDGNPALQGSIYFQSEDSGLYTSVFATTTDLDTPTGEARFEIDLSAGAQGIVPLGVLPLLPEELTDSDWLGWDASLRYYFYPDSDARRGFDDFDFFEVSAGLSYHFDLFSGWTRIAYSPEFLGNLGEGRYYAGGLDVPLPMDFSVGGHVGYQDVAENNNGEHDTLDWSLSLTKTLRPDLSITAAYTDTDLRDASRCYYGSDACDARALISITKRW